MQSPRNATAPIAALLGVLSFALSPNATRRAIIAKLSGIGGRERLDTDISAVKVSSGATTIKQVRDFLASESMSFI
jgi:hypothetical protein